jgi:predicted Zn-dependent protease
LITHLWYVNYVNPMQTIVTGTTRDGTFLIEEGRVTKAVKDMRFRQSILEALSNVEMMTKDLKLCPQYGARLLVPSVKVRDFEFVANQD